MTDQLVIDLNADGTASVLTLLDSGDLPQATAAFELKLPVTSGMLEDLRWYLEDYLILPAGVYGERGQQIEGNLAQWGERMFTAVFGQGPGRDAYQLLRSRNPMLVFRSQSPELLALPWELIRDPAQGVPLALDLTAISRSLRTEYGTATVPGGKLRVLMVIARPSGERDVGYQNVARPLLDRLHAVRGQVELTVLRPPTLDALAAVLAEQRFHVVHFDGHGSQHDSGSSLRNTSHVYLGHQGEGMLLLEKPHGGPDPVPAAVLGRLLANVPVVVLNACQSGAIGSDLAATIATRLLAEGTASVVAMAYSVYAVAASEFMAAFYDRLFAGDPVSAAVTAGRQRMFRNDGRPSRKGDLPLADWLVPVHYLRRDVRFPLEPAPQPAGRLSLNAELDRIRAAETAPGASILDPVGTFIGRDWLTCQLETAARLLKVIVLHGTAGTGKTELAKAFARWWRETGGIDDPGYIYFHSFEPGSATFGLDGVVNEIGRALFASDFDRLGQDERRLLIEQVVTERRMLLIWDNFETVRSLPEHKPLNEDGGWQLRQFLDRLSRGNSTVLITSRSAEEWLGALHRITVAGLTAPEANQYADHLLAPYPRAAASRAKPAFGELMDWLDGHPLSMRLILPQLDTNGPAELLAALQGTRPLPGGTAAADGRQSSLPASIAYSYRHLSEQTRGLLPAISLLHEAADIELLSRFAAAPGVPDRFRPAGDEDWRQVLAEAAGTGLLAAAGSAAGRYRIHPALPAFLADQWRDLAGPEAYPAELAAATRAMVTACAQLCEWSAQQITSGAGDRGYGTIELHGRTLDAMLAYAVDHQLWAEASQILNPLSQYWFARDLNDEIDGWVDRLRLATEGPGGEPPEFGTIAGQLWVSTLGMHCSRHERSRNYDRAQQLADQLRTLLEAQPGSPQRDGRLGMIYHQLAVLAQGQGQPAEADRWSQLMLELALARDDKWLTGQAHLILGEIAGSLNQLDRSEQSIRRALAVAEEEGDDQTMVPICQHLAELVLAQGRIAEAETWTRKSLAICTQIGYLSGTYTACSQLGNIAMKRHSFDEAEDWYRQALAIAEETGEPPLLTNSYHFHGVLAQQRGQLGIAADWYHKALELAQRHGDVSQLTSARGQLGLLAEERGDIGMALDWTIQCVAQFEEFPHPLTQEGPQVLARLTARLGSGTLAERWLDITGAPLPAAVRDYVRQAQADDD